VGWMSLYSDPSVPVLERILARKIPLWLVAAIVMFCAVATVSFGWFVKRSVSTDDERPLALAALAIASFPSQTKEVFKEIARILSGKPEYGAIKAYPPKQSWSEFQPVKSRLEGAAREISIAKIITANPEIDILELRRKHENVPTKSAGTRPGRWLADPFHLNDADPIARNLANRFPMFAAGDLLISARELNLVFVIDPSAFAIKWRRIGEIIRQHDPDWMVNGRLSVYNNRMARSRSEIVEIDPSTLGKTVAVNGNDIGFYARAGGKQQLIPGGNWIISNSWQGKVVEASPGGEIALEFSSVLDVEGSIAAIMGDAIFLPEEAFVTGAIQCGEP
jgi:Arylsulfotransferase (ASST)